MVKNHCEEAMCTVKLKKGVKALHVDETHQSQTEEKINEQISTSTIQQHLWVRVMHTTDVYYSNSFRKTEIDGFIHAGITARGFEWKYKCQQVLCWKLITKIRNKNRILKKVSKKQLFESSRYWHLFIRQKKHKWD